MLCPRSDLTITQRGQQYSNIFIFCCVSDRWTGLYFRTTKRPNQLTRTEMHFALNVILTYLRYTDCSRSTFTCSRRATIISRMRYQHKDLKPQNHTRVKVLNLYEKIYHSLIFHSISLYHSIKLIISCTLPISTSYNEAAITLKQFYVSLKV